MITDPSWMVKRYSVTTLLNSQPHKPKKFGILIADMGRTILHTQTEKPTVKCA